MKRRKSDCAGEGDGNVRGMGESEWAPAAQLARLTCALVCALVCARATVRVFAISVLLLFTFQALQRGNQRVWRDQPGLVLPESSKTPPPQVRPRAAQHNDGQLCAQVLLV